MSERQDGELGQFNEAELTTMFDYLDELRESGVTNMFGAGAYLQRKFSADKKAADTVLGAWMRTFSREQPCDERARAALLRAKGEQG